MMTTETQAEATTRPIIFTGESVRAILDGRKTQTRRVMRVQPPGDSVSVTPWMVDGEWQERESGMPLYIAVGAAGDCYEYGCHYGKTGDRLWVRETWACITGIGDDPSPDDAIEYRADGSEAGAVITRAKAWRPSMFMPRAYSRLTLEITDIRVQRVQEISEADAIAEGCRGYMIDSPTCSVRVNAKSQYAELWDIINARRGYSWDSDPWCWCITFRRIAAG